MSLGAIILLLIFSNKTHSSNEKRLNQYNQQTTSVQATSTQDSLAVWIKDLAFCESSNNPLAVNPKDRDGRPKYGLFQFDMQTWKMYIKRYDLFHYTGWEEADWWNTIYSGYHQEIVLREMIKNGVNLEKEFGCVKKIGLIKLESYGVANSN